MSAKTAKILRIVTLPQLLVFVMILLLRDQYPKGHALAAILTLSIFPLLSYPVCKFVPALAKGGRPTQRKTAVIFAVAGYAAGLVFSFAADGSATEQFVYLCYSLCGVLIAVSTRLFGLKASGHACGAAGPAVILAIRKSIWYLFGLLALIPVFVSSLVLKRHTKRELILGGLYACIAGILLTLVIPVSAV